MATRERARLSNTRNDQEPGEDLGARRPNQKEEQTCVYDAAQAFRILEVHVFSSGRGRESLAQPEPASAA